MMNLAIKGRIFLVGCPRSGTTLLQSLVAGHPDVASFPESNLFHCLTSPDSRRGKLGIASKGARKAFIKFLAEINQPDMTRFLPPYALSLQQYATAFTQTLDTLALQQQKSWWLEKTPYHLRRIDIIEKFVSDPKFVHIVRNGEDVVASLYEVTHHHPDIWGGAKDIDQCLSEWRRDIHLSAHYASRGNHAIVRYEHLLQNPASVLQKVCRFIGLSYSDELLERRSLTTNKIVKRREVWKDDVAKPIQSNHSKKFRSLFSSDEQQYILTKVSETNLD
ncbi:MAG: sulfotransferase, partial [Cyanobacteria bacterium J06636_16]